MHSEKNVLNPVKLYRVTTSYDLDKIESLRKLKEKIYYSKHFVYNHDKLYDATTFYSLNKFEPWVR